MSASASLQQENMDMHASAVLLFGSPLPISRRLPKAVRDKNGSVEIRAWFDAADADSDGTLSSMEFFSWTISGASAEFGASSIDSVFARYDDDVNGTGLDIAEFERMCMSMGFGSSSAAQEIFRALDTDVMGTVTIRELKQAITCTCMHA